MRPLRWRPVQFAVYLAVRFVAAVVQAFPYAQAPALARALAAVWRRLDGRHRRTAERNLARAGMPVSLVPRVFENLALLGVEMILARRGDLSRHVRIHGLERYEELRRAGRGVLLTIGHLGNWELAGIAFSKLGHRLHSLARPLENPWLDRWLLGERTRTGQAIVPKRGALPAMSAVLRAGGTLVVQVDQDARKSGVLVEFFGHPASTVRSAAILSLKFGAPILPVEIWREGGLHHLRADEPIFPEAYRGRPDAVRDLTQAFTSRLELHVRRHPEQWNWLHRRWKAVERAEARASAAAPDGSAPSGASTGPRSGSGG